MKRITTGIILLALILGTFSCGSEPSGTNETTTAADVTVETTSGSGLPELDFGGETVTIFVEDYGGYCGAEFYVDETNGDIVNDAIYNRNSSVEDKLHVDLEWVALTHTWDTRDEYLTKFRTSVLAADAAFDIATGIGYFMPSFVAEGLLSDMSSLPYIDPDKAWWSKDYMEKSSVDGRYYVATGDISLGMIKDMMCVFENLELAEKLGIENLYDIVRAGEWTFDKMKTLTANIYSDLDGDTKIGRGDQFGLLFHNPNHFTGFLESFNVDIVDTTGGKFEFVFGNEHNVDVVEKLVDLISNNDGVYYDPTGNHETVDDSIFRTGNVLLTTGWLANTDTFRTLEFDYGVLPYPKYDESQAEYHTTVLNNHSVVSIPVDSKDRDRAAAVIEALAYESWNSVTPAYFEIALKVKYARDNDSSQMFDIIRDGISFDFGYIYTAQLGGINDVFKNKIAGKNSSWSSAIASIQSATEQQLSDLVKAIRENAQ